jgi:murein DD-endopeptidase MepM/ murein hydrolase activator NlpD
MYPVKEPHRITSPYGNRNSPITGKQEFHPGIDIVSDSGEKTLFAIADGVIVDDKDDYNDANRWNIKGKDTVGNRFVYRSIINGKIIYITYYHTAKNNVSVGDKIKKGQIIGEYGDVGYSKGAHVHLQAWDKEGYEHTGKTIDPSFLLEV